MNNPGYPSDQNLWTRLTFCLYACLAAVLDREKSTQETTREVAQEATDPIPNIGKDEVGAEPSHDSDDGNKVSVDDKLGESHEPKRDDTSGQTNGTIEAAAPGTGATTTNGANVVADNGALEKDNIDDDNDDDYGDEMDDDYSDN